MEDVLSVTFKASDKKPDSEYILFSPVLTISSNESSFLEVTAGNDPINQVIVIPHINFSFSFHSITLHSHFARNR